MARASFHLMQIPTHAINVHGGAGTISDGRYAKRLAGCKIAAEAGWEILCRASTALDAVQRAVEALEDNPWFNDGTGAVRKATGGIQLDASLMDGTTLAAGAVATITRLKHPIRLARYILEDGRHVLLVGEAASNFARICGIAECSEQALITSR